MKKDPNPSATFNTICTFFGYAYYQKSYKTSPKSVNQKNQGVLSILRI